MKKIGLFYGSTTGNTENVAQTIAQKLEIASSSVFSIDKATPERLLEFDVLILGSSTWGVGDLQDDWDGFIGKFEKLNLAGKQVALFGTGDSSSYSDSFCDAIGILAEAVEKTGATLIGDDVNTADYSFDSSKAVKRNVFCGLALDEDNESNKTEERITRWIASLNLE